jgi:RNA polymerase sigma-70 factor (ECF subfamily)
MEQGTKDLIHDLRQHQPAACQQLFTTYGPAVYRMIQRIVPCREDAEEVYQDVFVKALRGIDGYDNHKASLTTWLSRIAYHESINFIRTRRPDIVYMDSQELVLNGIDDRTEEEQDNNLSIQLLEQAITMLPPNDQAIITMFYYDNMSLADIAYVTGSNPSTVGSQLCRIRKKLYRMIEKMRP